jgi:hypothetical protein
MFSRVEWLGASSAETDFSNIFKACFVSFANVPGEVETAVPIRAILHLSFHCALPHP